MTEILSNEYLTDLFKRLELSVREEWAKGKSIEEIRLRPAKYSLLLASCPPHMLEVTTDREGNKLLQFVGIPLKRASDIDKEFDWQLKFNKT